jgi:hypothetical protein
MKKLNFILPMMTLLAMILGCGEIKTKPKVWKKARAMTERLDHPNALASDEKFIYFITGGTVASRNEGTNNVMKMPLDGDAAAPTILFKGGDIIPDAETIALDENYVYFSANGLRRAPKKGGEATLLTKAFIAWEIVVDKDNVYWMPFVGEGMPPAPVYSVPKTGGEPKTMTDPRPSANGLCLDEKFLYWIQTDGIYKTGKQGGANIEKIYSIPPDGEIVSDLKNDADNFYFLQVKSRKLMKLSKSGGEAKELAKDVGQFWLGDKEIVFQRWVYSSDMAIMKIDKNGEGETELDVDGYLSALTVSKSKIYLSDIVKIYELEKF